VEVVMEKGAHWKIAMAVAAATLGCLVAGTSLAEEPAAADRLVAEVASDPAAAVFVAADVEHFLEAMAAVDAGEEPASALERLYFARATPGLRMFREKYDLTHERLLAALEKYPEDYARIGATLRHLRAREEAFRAAYAGLAREVPDAVFPPTYFVVAAHRGIGSGSVEGPLVSIEKESPESIDRDLAATLVHEMVHMQQLAAVGPAYFEIFSGPGRSLLALSIREGAATWLAERVTGGSEHKNAARDFLREHEPGLWASFHETMLGPETGDWLWRQPADPRQPRDVGYAIGARIAASYFERHGESGEAMSEILEVTDYPGLLARSGYPEAMERRAAQGPAPIRIEALGWLAGCWAAEGGEPGSGEQWTRPAGGTMLGTARTIASGRTVEREFLEIRETLAGDLLYLASPSGQKATWFRQVGDDGSSLVFENPDHDFPQRILYRLGEDGRLVARVEGESDGRPEAIDFPMRRVPCNP
jgi:hypothetical protein